MGSVFQQNIPRKLANGTKVNYKSRHWLCRYYLPGTGMVRHSTGTTDKAEAQRLCDCWEKQARAGLPLDPSPTRRERLVGATLSGVDGPSRDSAYLDYIHLRRHLGIPPEAILSELIQLFSSGSNAPKSGVPSRSEDTK